MITALCFPPSTLAVEFCYSETRACSFLQRVCSSSTATLQVHSQTQESVRNEPILNPHGEIVISHSELALSILRRNTRSARDRKHKSRYFFFLERFTYIITMETILNFHSEFALPLQTCDRKHKSR